MHVYAVDFGFYMPVEMEYLVYFSYFENLVCTEADN